MARRQPVKPPVERVARGLDFRTGIVGCARCHGRGHDDLLFSPLTHPVELDDGSPPFTHYAPCPTNGEPILFCVREPADA